MLYFVFLNFFISHFFPSCFHSNFSHGAELCLLRCFFLMGCFILLLLVVELTQNYTSLSPLYIVAYISQKVSNYHTSLNQYYGFNCETKKDLSDRGVQCCAIYPQHMRESVQLVPLIFIESLFQAPQSLCLLLWPYSWSGGVPPR